MSDIALTAPGVQSAIAFPGLSINGFTNSSSAGIVFVTLKPFDERKGAALSGNAIAASLNQKFAAIQDSFIAVFPPPPVMGLGTLGGFKLQLEDRAALGYAELDKAKHAVLENARQTPELGPSFSSYEINVPQLDVDLDRVKAKQLGVPVTEVFDTMQLYLGACASRCAVPSARRRHPAAEDPQCRGRHGAAVVAGDRQADLRA
ncbi:hypothetical protein G6F59_015308 [Rhizopus arrhizus]|nr:hypothetical protein G6F59_015308 [Rhizopus arrhizus]